MGGFELRGVAGRVCWSYHVAMEIGSFNITPIRKSEQAVLRATVRSADPFKAQQSPLVFEALIGKAVWRWALSEVVIDGALLTAKVIQTQ